MLKHVNNQQEFKELIQNGTVLVDFFATWCGPCKMLSPLLEEISNESDILILKVDVDEASALAAEFTIQAVPTLMLFKDPTLPDAVAGDITAAMPYRAMTNIINFIQAMDEVVPGFASTETLLYSPELKFYSNKVKMEPDLTTNVKGLYCLGDSSGWTRGLMMASSMGVLMGRKLV